MLKLFSFVLLIVLFTSCGVDTSSSQQSDSSSVEPVDQDTNDLTNDLTGFPIDPNPVVDINNTTPTDPTDPTDPVLPGDGGNQDDSVFDVEDAYYDQFACLKGDVNDGYTNNSLVDTTTDDRGNADQEDGVEINSKYPAALSETGTTEVSVFYYDLLVNRDMYIVNIYEDYYRLTVDKAWAYNDEKRMYVMLPKNIHTGLLTCYRYELSTINQGTYTKTKVYRNKI